MKANVRNLVLILPLLLTSCVHKTNQAVIQPPLAPPIEDAPLPKPDNAPANLPPPVISMPDKKDTTTAPPAPKPQTPAPPPKHKKSPAKTAPAQTPTPSVQTTEQASNAGSSVPAIGNLSSGEPADLKDKTQSIIADTEKELNGINRKLNEQDTKTSDQIREFLRQARTALSTNDVAGAHTLALKAKVLLDEINQ
jgi:outer membrane biosynthesis protein TonB